MWRLKQFMPKDSTQQASLEGKSIEIGSFKLQVRSLIAQGGFSSVYLARDAQSGKSYALKHIICNDNETLDLARKEAAVMKSLRGHPNVITLHAQAVFDTGRTKDFFLVMDYCEKTLVNVLDNRGAGYFDEKQLLLLFRDVCNAVYAMHSLSPPVAHRDLKAENLLMGADGAWKLCDFGSTSTNHRRFEKAEEMGLEEDVIRKHTTPAYRAPEMWDLFRREFISEKVDIWALGCLLYRISYLKSAFDGESKLQILNGNYRVPEVPRYSSALVDLIRDMLQASPEARPNILQVWKRVNESLPSDCRKPSPDKTIAASSNSPELSTSSSRTVAPSRSPPPPPQPTKGIGTGAGSFWNTEFAKDAKYDGTSPPATSKASSQCSSSSVSPSTGTSSSGPSWSARFTSAAADESRQGAQVDGGSKHSTPATGAGGELKRSVQPCWDKEVGIGDGRNVDKEQGISATSTSRGTEAAAAAVSSDGAFNAFVAEFDSSVQTKGEQQEVDKLKQRLSQALAEKSEYMSKYEKLTAICRSQRQEIQELKTAIASANQAKPPPVSRRTNPVTWKSEQQQAKDKDSKQNGSIWELQEGMTSAAKPASTTTTKPTGATTSLDIWQTSFSSESASSNGSSKLQNHQNRTMKQQHHSRAASMGGGADGNWGFVQQESSGSSLSSSSFRAEPMKKSQAPAGWAGF